MFESISLLSVGAMDRNTLEQDRLWKRVWAEELTGLIEGTAQSPLYGWALEDLSMLNVYGDSDPTNQCLSYQELASLAMGCGCCFRHTRGVLPDGQRHCDSWLADTPDCRCCCTQAARLWLARNTQNGFKQ